MSNPNGLGPGQQGLHGQQGQDHRGSPVQTPDQIVCLRFILRVHHERRALVVLIRIYRRFRWSCATRIARGLHKGFGDLGSLVPRYSGLSSRSLQPVKSPNRVSLPDAVAEGKIGISTLSVLSRSQIHGDLPSQAPRHPNFSVRAEFSMSVWETSLRDPPANPLKRLRAGLNL